MFSFMNSKIHNFHCAMSQIIAILIHLHILVNYGNDIFILSIPSLKHKKFNCINNM